MGVEIFVSGKISIKKDPDTCGRGLRVDLFHGSINAQ